MQNTPETQTFTQRLKIQQTNIFLQCDFEPALILAEQALRYNRTALESYISQNPLFLSSIEPLEIPENVPEIIKIMSKAGLIADVGPMASVAGALAEIAAEAILKAGASYAVAENGGDISIMGNKQTTIIGIYDGNASVNGADQLTKFGFKIRQPDLPIGICTSAGKIGHSISFGDANAAIAVAGSATIADAAATALGNRIQAQDVEGSLQNALEFAEQLRELRGCMVIVGNLIGRVGKLPELIELENNNKIEYY